MLLSHVFVYSWKNQQSHENRGKSDCFYLSHHNQKDCFQFILAVQWTSKLKTKNVWQEKWIWSLPMNKKNVKKIPQSYRWNCPICSLLASLHSWYLPTMHLHWPSDKLGSVKFSFPLSLFMSCRLFWSCLEYTISDPPSLLFHPWIWVKGILAIQDKQSIVFIAAIQSHLLLYSNR